MSNCRGQSYDNAPNMSGVNTGLQSRIKEVSPTAVYSPCSGHALNLVGEHAASCCKESNDFFLLLQNLYVFFSSSTHRWDMLQQNLRKPENVSLKGLSQTRWSARDDACKSLNKNTEEIIKTLAFISESELEKPCVRNEASAYLQQVQRLETVILAFLWGDILDRFNCTAKKLQASDIDLSVVAELYNSLQNYIQDLREKFDFYEKKGMEKSSITEYEDNIKGKRKRKRHFDETTDNEVELNGRQNFRVKSFIVIIDRLTAELDLRKKAYEELNLRFSFITEGTTMDSVKITKHAENLSAIYTEDLPSSSEFTNECLHFFGFIKSLKEPPSTILELSQMIFSKGPKEVYPYINIALNIFLCIPGTNCSSERSFSVLRRVKNYLRSTMTDDYLNCSAVLIIESELTRSIDYDDLIDSFARLQPRRKVL